MTRQTAHGMWDDEYAALLETQGGGCAICGRPPKTRRLHVDHDHKTNRVRGLLCYRCNRALPSYVTVEWLAEAIKYLARPSHAELVALAEELGSRIAHHAGRA